MGTLRAMQARDINLDYADDGRTRAARDAGRPEQRHPGRRRRPAQPGQRLAAEFIDIALGPDGAVTSLSSRERVVVTLPAAGGAPARTIRSVELTGDGAAGAGLTSMRFEQQVEFREGGTARTPPARMAHARGPDAGPRRRAAPLERATFTGEARFEDGTLRAAAAEARYLVDRATGWC